MCFVFKYVLVYECVYIYIHASVYACVQCVFILCVYICVCIDVGVNSLYLDLEEEQVPCARTP